MSTKATNKFVAWVIGVTFPILVGCCLVIGYMFKDIRDDIKGLQTDMVAVKVALASHMAEVKK